jgi:serine/threonine protein kinase
VLAVQECNLYQLMKGCQGMLPEHLVREWCATIFEGLAFIHKQGYFHRDLKPGASQCQRACSIPTSPGILRQDVQRESRPAAFTALQ